MVSRKCRVLGTKAEVVQAKGGGWDGQGCFMEVATCEQARGWPCVWVGVQQNPCKSPGVGMHLRNCQGAQAAGAGGADM